MSIKSVLSRWARGFDPDKYFSCREKFYKTKSSFMKMYYKYKVLKAEGSAAYIGLYDNAENRDIFENRPVLLHGIQGLFITAEARIGKNAKIMQNVTIGTSKGVAPVIGDNVFIGANACIIGGIKIGNNVRIGAGAVVVKDVPDNTTVVAQPCRYIQKSGDYHYVVDAED